MFARNTAIPSVAIAIWLLASSALTDAKQPTAAPDTQEATWRFRVYLDEREIGFHHFYLSGREDTRLLRSVAEFEYKLAFLTLFDYRHENLETWSGNCLQRIESRTDANGEPYAVTGLLQAGAFRVEGSAGTAILPDCVMSFAYWNPAFLQQPRLLNSQNGDYLAVEVSPPVTESLEVRGEEVPAKRFHLKAKGLSLHLWYSTDNQWLALESEVRGGRKLRYELM